MRMKPGTVVAVAGILVLALACWQPGRLGWSPQHAVAQDISPHTAEQSAPSRGDAERKADAKLRQRLSFVLEEASLTTAMGFICHEVGLQFYLKTRDLEEIGIDSDAPVSLELHDVTAKMGLELILEQLDLAYVIRDDVIVVTTDEALCGVGEVRVYNCRDLLAEGNASDTMTDAAGMEAGPTRDLKAGEGEPQRDNKKSKARQERRTGSDSSSVTPGRPQSIATVRPDVLAQFGGGGLGGMGMGGGEMGMMMGGGMGDGMGGAAAHRAASRSEQLMAILTTSIKPDSWEQVGGQGTIAEFDGLLVIRQDPRVHKQVAEVLEMIRDATATQPWTNPADRPYGRTERRQGGGGGFF